MSGARSYPHPLSSVAGRLTGRHAVVTGGAGGIGAAVASTFARAGAGVTLCDLNPVGLDATVASLADDPDAADRMVARVCDIRDRAQVDAMLEAGRQRFGPVDIVAHVAGTAWHVSLSEMGDDDYDRLMDVHVRATFHLLRATVEEFKERGSGKFIAVTSPAAVRGQVNGTIYSAAKSAVLGIVRSAALELAPFGAQVNAVLPMAATPMTELVVSDPSVNERYLANVPLHRWGSPVEIARGFLYLASADSDYVTGTVLTIDGGRTI
jgi:3-oxoacyl-[acyl-carrier protein] reductase